MLLTQEKRDSSARSVPRNDNVLSFSAACEACATKTDSHSLLIELGYFGVESRNPSHGFDKCELTACGKNSKFLWVVPLGTT